MDSQLQSKLKFLWEAAHQQHLSNPILSRFYVDRMQRLLELQHDHSGPIVELAGRLKRAFCPGCSTLFDLAPGIFFRMKVASSRRNVRVHSKNVKVADIHGAKLPTRQGKSCVSYTCSFCGLVSSWDLDKNWFMNENKAGLREGIQSALSFKPDAHSKAQTSGAAALAPPQLSHSILPGKKRSLQSAAPHSARPDSSSARGSTLVTSGGAKKRKVQQRASLKSMLVDQVKSASSSGQREGDVSLSDFLLDLDV